MSTSLTVAPGVARTCSAHLVICLIILLIGFAPEGPLRKSLRNMRAPEWNRVDRDKHAVGYYVGLIDGGATGRDPLSRRLMGEPSDWSDFHSIRAVEFLPGDPLQFRLRPDITRVVFGKPFTTNSEGLRDHPTSRAKPPGVFRIALLGSSIDMGWGVGDEETYENRLEVWLNKQAKRRGLTRTFEIQNFAMAAYSPLHRVLHYERVVRDFDPDLVLYAATMLDPRLLEIHLAGLLREGVSPSDPFIESEYARVGIGFSDFASAVDPRTTAAPDEKNAWKSKLRPLLLPFIDHLTERLAAQARAEGRMLGILLVPRASESTASRERSRSVAHFRQLADKHRLPLVVLTHLFDRFDQADIGIAPWDDHPNARGHELLYKHLAHELMAEPALAQVLFPPSPEPESVRSQANSVEEFSR